MNSQLQCQQFHEAMFEHNNNKDKDSQICLAEFPLAMKYHISSNTKEIQRKKRYINKRINVNEIYV